MTPCPSNTPKVWALPCHREKTRELWQHQILIQKIDKTSKSTQPGLRAVYPLYSTQYSAFLPIRAKHYSRSWHWTFQCDSDGISTGLYRTSQWGIYFGIKTCFSTTKSSTLMLLHFIEAFRLVYSSDPSDNTAQCFFFDLQPHNHSAKWRISLTLTFKTQVSAYKNIFRESPFGNKEQYFHFAGPTWKYI